MSKGYLYDNGDELISREDALPDTSEALSGDILGLNSDKEPEWITPESGLPDTSEASAGDVLSLDEDKEPVWTPPSGGEGIDLTYALQVDISPDTRIYFFNSDGTPKSLATIIAEADGTPVFTLNGTGNPSWSSFDDVTFSLMYFMKSPISFTILASQGECYFVYESFEVSLSDAEDKTVNYVEIPR